MARSDMSLQLLAKADDWGPPGQPSFIGAVRQGARVDVNPDTGQQYAERRAAPAQSMVGTLRRLCWGLRPAYRLISGRARPRRCAPR